VKGRGGIIGGLARLVQNYGISLPQRRRVETKGDQRGKKLEEEVWGGLIDPLPHRIQDSVWNGADEGVERARAHSISQDTSSGQSLNGRRMETAGARGASGKKCARRALFSSSGVEAPGSSGKQGGGRPIATFWAVQTDGGVAVARKELQWSLFAFLMALK